MIALRRCAIVIALLLILATPANAVERIIRFISDVAVQHNGDLIVTETLRVEAEGKDIRRGLLRDFPTVVVRHDATLTVVGFEVQSVTRNGKPENYVTEQLENGVRVRIGRADILLNPGQHEYELRYRTTRQLDFLSDFDSLSWNATGTAWPFPIDQAEARIVLPAKVPFLRTFFVTGPQGVLGKDATIVEQVPGRIVFRTTRTLSPREGLTVVAAWEKGVIEAPSLGAGGVIRGDKR